MNSLPLLHQLRLHISIHKLSGLTAPFHLPNKHFQNLHSGEDDWYHCILQRPRGKLQVLQRSAKSGCFQKEQIFLLHPFSRVYPSVSQVVCCVRVQTAQKGRGRTLKHGLGFAESTDISPPLPRVKVLYTTSQMTASKAHRIPWTTTIPILFWWSTQRQTSRMEPPSYASPWRSTSRSSARDTGVSRFCARVWSERCW